MGYICMVYDVEGQQTYANGYELDSKTVTVRWLIEWYENEASLVKTVANKHLVYSHRLNDITYTTYHRDFIAYTWWFLCGYGTCMSSLVEFPAS